jgi:hypothetical protein
MEKNKSVVEQALLQMKAIEEAISENAKGILASTMKEEIAELVKESLKEKTKLTEQDEEDSEMDVEMEDDMEVEDETGDVEFDAEMEDEGEDDSEMLDMDFDMEDDNEDELPPLDLTQASADEVLRVFKAMGDEDGIIIKKQDDGDIHLVDNNNDTEYLITFGGESAEAESMNMMENYMDEEEMDESWSEEMDEEEMDEEEMDEEEMDEEEMDEEEMDENVYEIDQETLESVLESFKAKGVGMGKPGSGMSKTSVNMKGFKEEKKSGGKGVGMGKPNFKYPSKMKGGVTETETDEMEEAETTEASRTLGSGRKWGRKGLPKPKAAPRHLEVESIQSELNLLREKNEEYKKALDFLRKKMDEVAVFNSNLAYATRLFTEHSTTKQEKINVLRRFDNVETIKESKTLYKTIKDELSNETTSQSITESVQQKVVKTPQNGSSTNLIESKTYENPQFMRMKDLMTKIK